MSEFPHLPSLPVETNEDDPGGEALETETEGGGAGGGGEMISNVPSDFILPPNYQHTDQYENEPIAYQSQLQPQLSSQSSQFESPQPQPHHYPQSSSGPPLPPPSYQPLPPSYQPPPSASPYQPSSQSQSQSQLQPPPYQSQLQPQLQPPPYQSQITQDEHLPNPNMVPPITIHAQITLNPDNVDGGIDVVGPVLAPEVEQPQGIGQHMAPMIIQGGSGGDDYSRRIQEHQRKEKRKRQGLVVVFICSLLILIIPSLAAIFDYIASLQLMMSIDSTRSDYSQMMKILRADVSNRDVLNQIIICNTTGVSDTYLMFAKFATESGNCTCQSTTVDCSQSHNEYSSYTTSNVDGACNNIDTSIPCTQCECGTWNAYSSQSVQYAFALNRYNSLNEDDTKKYCSLTSMTDTVDSSDDKISTTFDSCYITSFTFLVVSGIAILANFCACYGVRVEDVKAAAKRISSQITDAERLYQETKRRELSREEYSCYVCSVIMMHIFLDIPQSVVAVIFAIYKQGDASCLTYWSNQDFGNALQAPISAHGKDAWSIITQYQSVETFLVLSFLHVFITGVMAIRLANFDTQRLPEYSYGRLFCYIFFALLLGVIFCFVMFAPIWGTCWSNAGQLEIGQHEKQVMFYLFIVGLICWGLACCIPMLINLCYTVFSGTGGDCGCGCCC